MILPHTLLNVVDNSRGRELMCIQRTKLEGPSSKRLILQPKARRPKLVPRSSKLNVPS
ncbi:hypothetical protein AXF42_Ash020782 [Apostasia shenzhenica]|uniref:Uncharacterized protein n=1 Tax=Apostasia shenzhenica TaxID=1088818 RepID=A0A2I0A4J5_9ASPA|nr:hypothetical protein AXF42_Ash020782 [Apostasia shenzhenica]